jgi:ABC-2 type transport system ATP-binding protein
MTSQHAAISVTGLRKTYAGKDAVAGLDLEVHRGEIFAILGPNGAGKTTTVEILEGYRTRDAGDVLVLGEDPSHPSSGDRTWRNRIGIVLQSAADAPDLTVKETVHHFAHYYAKAKNPDEVIGLVGLSDKASAKVAMLSGGQRRRLDVALGIIGSPEILFLDEPTTGFDPEARRAFWGLIRTLRDEGTTILLTTHYLDEAEALADRVAVINKGQVLEVATPETLGGRATAPALVTWSEGGKLCSESTQTPTEFLKALSARIGGEIPDLAITRPSLEDIYLGMIGQL